MRFIHTADWHIGMPYARIEDQEKRVLVRAARLETVSRIGKAVREKSASFVLVAGDLFDSNTPSNSTVSRLCHEIGKLSVPVVVIPGNHDSAGPGTIWQQPFFQKEARDLAPNLIVALDAQPVFLDEAVILPCPCSQLGPMADPLEWLLAKDVFENLPNDLPRIVLAHGSVQEFVSLDASGTPGNASLDTISLDFIPEGQVDYVALGDWHATKKIDDRTWYCGTHEPDRFPKGEGYESGNILLVNVSRGQKPVVEKRHVASLRWHKLEETLSSVSDVRHLSQRINELTKGQVGRDLLRLELSGFLGIGATKELESLMEGWRAKFLWLDVKKSIELVPEDEEIATLTTRPDPLISGVASEILSKMQNPVDEREKMVAQQALRELYFACQRVLTDKADQI